MSHRTKRPTCLLHNTPSFAYHFSLPVCCNLFGKASPFVKIFFGYDSIAFKGNKSKCVITIVNVSAPAHIWDVTVQASEFACFLVSFVREWILAYARSHIHGYSVHLYDTNDIKRTSNNFKCCA